MVLVISPHTRLSSFFKVTHTRRNLFSGTSKEYHFTLFQFLIYLCWVESLEKCYISFSYINLVCHHRVLYFVQCVCVCLYDWTNAYRPPTRKKASLYSLWNASGLKLCGKFKFSLEKESLRSMICKTLRHESSNLSVCI